MIALFIADALHALGAPKAVVLLVMVGVGLWHFRTVMALFGRLAMVVRVAVALLAGGVFALSGVVPGLDVDVSLALNELVGAVDGVVSALLEVVGGVV